MSDMAALRLCLEHIAPPRRDAPVIFALPAMQSAVDAAKGAAAVLAAVAAGGQPYQSTGPAAEPVETRRRALKQKHGVPTD